MDITRIMILVVELIAAIAVAVVIPYIKSLIDANKLEKLLAYAQIGVQAAEMLFKESGMGEAKKQYVIDYLKSKGYELDVTELDVVIESAVLEMKNALLA